MLVYLSTEPHWRVDPCEHLNAHLCDPMAVSVQSLAPVRVTQV